MLGWHLIKVTGESMLPSLGNGSFALFRRAKTYRNGQTVLVAHPSLGRIVKRLARTEDNHIWLEGTGPLSVSSKSMGAIPHRAIQGHLIWATKP